MYPYRYLLIIMLSGFLLLSACGNADNVSHSGRTSQEVSRSADDSQQKLDGVVKVVVLTDGSVFVNSDSVPIESLAARFDSMSNMKEIWYHRESPGANEPHENALKAIAEISKRQLPVAMFLDRDFTQRVQFSE